MHDAFNLIHYCFQLRRRHRPLFASLQKPLQNLLPLKSLAPAILFDDHVRNLVNPFVRRESPLAFQTLAPPPNRVSGSPFARINHLVIRMSAKWTLHPFPPRPPWDAPRSASCASSSFSCSAISRNCPNETPSRINSGIPAMLHDANVISHSTSAAATAASFSTPNTCVYAKIASACAPPPTVGNCKIDPTSVIASNNKQSPTVNKDNRPPNPCETNR